MKTIAVDETNPAVAENAIRAYLQAQLQNLPEPPYAPFIVTVESENMSETSSKRNKPE